METYDFFLLKQDATLIAQDAILTHLDGKSYNVKAINEWVHSISNDCLKDLEKLSINFKYVVTCFIRQRLDGSVSSEITAYWDEKSDGACIVSWENSSISAFVVIAGLAI